MLELRKQLEVFLTKYPQLKIRSNAKNFEIYGFYHYSLIYKNEIMEGSKKIKIVVREDFPLSIPDIYIEKIPNGFNHINNDGTCCLASYGEIAEFLALNPTFDEYISKFLNPFIYSLDWYSKYKSFPFGEREHGASGISSYYSDNWGINLRQYFDLYHIIEKKEYRGHWLCFCDSNKRLRNCHGKKVLNIINNGGARKLFLKESTFLWKELQYNFGKGANEWKEKNLSKTKASFVQKFFGKQQLSSRLLLTRSLYSNTILMLFRQKYI